MNESKRFTRQLIGILQCDANDVQIEMDPEAMKSERWNEEERKEMGRRKGNIANLKLKTRNHKQITTQNLQYTTPPPHTSDTRRLLLILASSLSIQTQEIPLPSGPVGCVLYYARHGVK